MTTGNEHLNYSVKKAQKHLSNFNENRASETNYDMDGSLETTLKSKCILNLKGQQ